MAPELLDPSGFSMRNSNPTKKSDVYAFGVVTYLVSNVYFTPGMATKGNIQVITGQQPFPGVMGGTIVYNIVTGVRPHRPPGPNEWLSDDVWNFISRCWSPSWDGRPDINFAMNTLNDAADAVEVRRRKLYAAASDRGKRTSRRVSGASHGYDHEQRLIIVINRRSSAESRPVEASSW
jgi:serine/threonine protein kinase